VTRRELGIAPGTPVILSVGSLTRQKAQHILIEAFARAVARVPAARLLIAGDGPLREELVKRSTSLGVGQNVSWLGAREDIADLIEAADLFVLSSKREGLPITVIEAMRGGRAVVTSRAGGTAEAVLDGITGTVVDPGDPAALGDAMAAVLGDPARMAAWGEAGRRRWAERFTAERMVRDTEALYREALSRNGDAARVEPAGRAHASS
jgi:glycosyltransferase involved in cell wall biosynthesis